MVVFVAMTSVLVNKSEPSNAREIKPPPWMAELKTSTLEFVRATEATHGLPCSNPQHTKSTHPAKVQRKAPVRSILLIYFDSFR
jgi:hypothetical protein